MDLITKIFGKPAPGISPVEVQQKLSQKNKFLLLDVRQPEEFRNEHIKGARLIPLNDLHRRMHELPKNQEIVCVCRSGSRSQTAARQLRAAGYTVINLNGGMIAWTRAGLPVNKGKA